VTSQNSRNADRFCSHSILEVLAQIRLNTNDAEEVPADPAARKALWFREAHHTYRKLKFTVDSFRLDSVLRCFMVEFLLAPCHEIME
jgi:hypothetical protein